MGRTDKRIALSELRLGMQVTKLGGSWLQHPFLRGSFLLTDAADIVAMERAGIKEVWIDESKGVELPSDARQVAQVGPGGADPGEGDGEVPASPSPSATKPGRSPRQAPASTSMASELEQARKLCKAAKEQVMAMFQDARLGKATDPNDALPLVSEIAASVQRNASAIISVARLKSHDDYTYMHSVAVCALMLSLARQMGLDERQTRLAGLGGLMHDLGKAVMPLDVLNKPGKLTDAEFDVMKKHPVAGAQLLRQGGAEPEVEDIALHHHEKFNGKGYPHGLQGEAISVLSRMGAICDVYDAVTSIRPYKNAWDPAKAMREMAGWEGHFDKVIFNAFVKSVGIYPVGSLVRMASSRLAVVIAPGTESLLAPVVRVFYSLRSNEPVQVQTIDLASPGCKDSIVGPEDPAKWGFTQLERPWLAQ